MMGAVRSWLLAVIAVSLLCAVAGALMPPGAVKRVGRLVCGLVLMGAILSPLARLDAAEGQRWLDGWLASRQDRERALEETVNQQLKSIIEGDCAAYIVDKAAELGLTCRARVECAPGPEGLYLPVRVEVAGAVPAQARDRLREVIAQDLGVPPQAQIYAEEEEIP